MIEVKNISYSLGKKRLLSNINFEVESGDFWAIVGANGAGKSTLIKLLAKEYLPTQGEITLWGENQKHISAKKLAQKRAILAQHNRIDLAFKVKEVVLMGRYPFFDASPSKSDWEIVSLCLEKVGILHFAERSFPTLSGGEQQRVQLARALAQIWELESSFLLLDEPTNGLDLKHQYKTLNIAKDLTKQGYVVVAVIHDLNLALLYADKVLILKKGETLDMGLADEVLTSQNIEVAFDLRVEIQAGSSGQRPLIIPKLDS